jgi:terminase small subunit-like protein
MAGRLCRAKSSRTMKPCKRPPIRGAVVCRSHGGAAPQVKKAAEQRIKDYVANLIDPDKLLREAGWIARFDVRQLFDATGNLKPTKEWPAEVGAAIVSVEVVKRNVYTGDDKIDDVIKIKVADKLKALEMLFKNKGLLTDKLEVSGGADLLALLHEGRQRAAEKR